MSRQRQTPAEEILWELLRDRRFLDLKFRRQHQIGDYIADFYCHEHKLAIELDGGIHRTKEAKDGKRDAYMQSLGLTVLRFPNSDVLDAPDHVLSDIGEAVVVRPSPTGKGGGEGVAGYRHLFPSSFQDSPLGRIPKGWEVNSLESLLSLSRESVKPQKLPSEGFDHYSIPAYDEGGPVLSLGETIHSSKYLVPSNAVLISKINPHIPRVWLPNVSVERRSICSTEFLVCVPQDGVSREYVYCLLSSAAFLDEFAQNVTGTTGSHQRVRPTAFVATEAVLPPSELRTAFTQVTRSLFLESFAGNKESSRLVRIRDALLPRLLSGNLSLADHLDPPTGAAR